MAARPKAGDEKNEADAPHGRAQRRRADVAPAITAAHALQLQRLAGNRAVAGLLQRGYYDEPFFAGAVKEEEEKPPPPPPVVVDPRQKQYEEWLEEAKREPAAFQQGDVSLTRLTAEHRAAELMQEKVKTGGGKVIGPKAYWRPKGTPLHDVPVRYLTEDERRTYELQLNKDERRFYWRGKLYTTKDATQWGSLQNVQGRAIFVMTADKKLYVADQGAESTRSKDPQGGWLFHHSSFLAGQPVAAAGELVFEDGHLTGVTDASGHYRPELNHMRQVLQLFRDAGVDLGNVKMTLVKKKDFAEELVVPAALILDLPNADEFAVRQEVKRRAREKAEEDIRLRIGAAQLKEDDEEVARLYQEAVRGELIDPKEPAKLFARKELKKWAAVFLEEVWNAEKPNQTYDTGEAVALAYHEAGETTEALRILRKLQTMPFYGEVRRMHELSARLTA